MDSEEKAKAGCAATLLVLVVVLLCVITYVNSLYPEDVTGTVVDKEKVVSTQVHSGKDYFFITYSVTYNVTVRNDADEVAEKFSTNADVYAAVKVDDTGTFRVSGVKSLGRVLRAK